MNNSRYVDSHIHWHSINEMDPRIMELILKEFPQLSALRDNPDDASFLLNLMDAEHIEKAFIINYMSPRVMGYSFETNNWVSNFCSQDESRLIPVGGVDPTSVDNAGDKIRPLLETGRIKIVKIHGPHQLVKPNAYTKGLKSQAQLYETCQELKIPVLIHTGSSIFPKARSRFGNPLFVEDILIDYPDLDVTIAHGGRPFWTTEAQYLMMKFPKLQMDLSGIPPFRLRDYLPKFKKFAKRTRFGSDFPSPGVPGIYKNMLAFREIFQDLDLSQEVQNKIFRQNALNLLK